MENLNIEQFNPTKAELVELANKYKDLTINGIDDKIGYQQVDLARKELKKKRVDIEKRGKEMRDDAVKFQKAVITLEKEFVAIIEPLENELQEKQKAIDLEIEKNKRRETLPFKVSKLQNLGLEYESYDFILEMTEIEFDVYYNARHAEYLAEKERQQKEKQEQLEAEQKKIDDEKRLAEIKEKARIEAEEKAKQEIENIKLKAEKEKQDLIDKQLQEEKDKIKQQEDNEKAEKEKQDKLERQKKYQKWLSDNNYNETTDKLFNTDDGVKMYRFVAKY